MPHLNINWSILSLSSYPFQLCTYEVLHGGYEATTYKLSYHDDVYVLKVWDKQAKINIEQHYTLLKTLHEANIAIPNVYGYGTDEQANPVLLTSFDGLPIQKLNKNMLESLVKQLTKLHQLDLYTMPSLQLPRYHFATYFFPNLTHYNDLYHLLHHLLKQTDLQENTVIHGDYNLGNVVALKNKLTIIDWTNGQLGDARYDIAWSIALMNIYVSNKIADQYRMLFLQYTSYDKMELQLFEAIACIRYIVLLRNKYLSATPEQLKRLNMIMLNSPYLANVSLVEKPL